MGRTNKMTEGVFTDLVGNENEISSYDRFIKNGGEIKSLLLDEFLHEYKNIITENRDLFVKLSELEQVIMQIRSVSIMGDIKLSIVRNYIYARCPFYRKDKTSKDIRVIVDNVEFWTSDVRKLMKDSNFMEKARTKLIRAMNDEIGTNVISYREKYQTQNITQ